MFREINLEQALEYYKDEQRDVQIICNVNGIQMVLNLNEILTSSRFLAEFSVEESRKLSSSDRYSKPEMKELGDKGSETDYGKIDISDHDRDNNFSEVLSEECSRLAKEIFLDEKSSEERTEPYEVEGQESLLDLYNAEHTRNNEVKAEVEDFEDDVNLEILQKEFKQTVNDKLNSKKKGKSITIDLGKLFALKRAGWTQKNIAEELKCSKSTVSRYINNTELENKIRSLQNS